MSFSHLDAEGKPKMVDVSEKMLSARIAQAQAIVWLPNEIWQQLANQEIMTKKGAVFQTAILAGVMAVKRTADLIPLCHPLPVEKCNIDIKLADNQEVKIICTVGVTAKTGVEMEALTGASVAALTVYDMCKAFSQNIVIREIRLLEKTGGKTDYKRV